MRLVCLDSSPLVKLAGAEPESTALAVHEELAAVMTYGRRLREAAEHTHLEVKPPG